jgi:trans-aconitate 2-methyltransferase
VIYANASLQWLADHETLFPHLVAQLADNGTLAVQMPDNWQEPSHTLMRQVASEMGLPDRGRQPLLPPDAWYDLLTRQGCEVDIWRTTYFHPLASHQAISRLAAGHRIASLSGGLDEQAGSAFLTRYLALLAEHYPLQCNGKVLLRFHGCLSWREKSPPDRWDRWAEKRVMKGVKDRLYHPDFQD